MDNKRLDEVLESNASIDDMIETIRKNSEMDADMVNMLTLTSINKQLADISVTLAMICDGLKNNTGEK